MENEMTLNKNEINLVVELLTTAIEGLMEDLNQEGLSDQGATVLSERYHDLHRIRNSLRN